DGHGLRLQFFFQFVQARDIIIKRFLGLPKILFVRKGTEMLEAIAFGSGGVELRGRFGKSALGMKEKPKRDQQRDPECNQEIPEPAVFSVPIHGSFTGFFSSRRNS